MICLNAMLGGLNIDENDIVELVQGVIPAETIEVILNYYSYISSNDSVLLLLAGITVMITSSSAAFRELMNIMADIQGEGRFTGIFGTIFSFMLSILFLIAIYVSCVVIVGGEWLVDIVSDLVHIGIFGALWRWLRFVLLFFILYIIIHLIYVITAPKGIKMFRVPRSKGAFVAAFALVIISIVFSWFIGMSVKYTLVYGSLASVIILMIWLYLCGNILILGNTINMIYYKYKKKKFLDLYREGTVSD